MIDRDPTAPTPDPDDVPREPSKAELDAAMRDDADAVRKEQPIEVPDDDIEVLDADDSFPVAPQADDEAPVAVKHQPSKPAVIASGILAALLIALAVIAALQDPKSYMAEINRQQVSGLASILHDEKAATYSADEIKAAQEAWAKAGASRDMTAESAAEVLNIAKPESITADKINDVLKKREISFQTVEGLQSGLRNQILLFAITGVLAGAAAYFYQRGKSWARVVGMFVSGFIAVMYIMQIMQGALNIPGIIIVVSAAAAFYLLMRGRLSDPPPARPSSGMGLGGLFKPKPRNS